MDIKRNIESLLAEYLTILAMVDIIGSRHIGKNAEKKPTRRPTNWGIVGGIRD